MLKVTDVYFRYHKGSDYVLKGADLRLGSGEIGVLLGKNGSGKTTLFKNILGLKSPERGTIEVDGRDLAHLSLRSRAGLIAYVPQHIHFGALSVFDSVLLGRISRFGMKAGREDIAVVERVLKELGLEAYAGRNAEELSGGEKQKIAIARAIAQEPKLLVFDEPTGNLDIANEQLLFREVRALSRDRGITLLCSLHDLNEAMRLGDSFFFMKDGRVKYSGGREQFTEEIIKDIFGIDVRIIEYDERKVIINETL